MSRTTPEFKKYYKTPKKRSHVMSHIHGRRTSIENILALKLWHQGIHYRRNYKKLPGKPDITLTKYNIAVFCDGDYWHGYRFNEYKKTHWHRHRKYWIHKITYNMKRDKRQTR